MKKFISLLVCLSMLICMFTFAPTASAAEMYDANGETIRQSVDISGDAGPTTITYWITCNNGWLDGTNGYDYVEAGMSSTAVTTGSASVNVTATYICDGTYTDESDSVSDSALGPLGISVTVAPNTDLLSYGYADFNLNCTRGSLSRNLSASCPTGVK